MCVYIYIHMYFRCVYVYAHIDIQISRYRDISIYRYTCSYLFMYVLCLFKHAMLCHHAPSICASSGKLLCPGRLPRVPAGHASCPEPGQFRRDPGALLRARGRRWLDVFRKLRPYIIPDENLNKLFGP